MSDLLSRFYLIKTEIINIRSNNKLIDSLYYKNTKQSFKDSYGPLYIIALNDAMHNAEDFSLIDIMNKCIRDIGYDRDFKFNSISSPEDEFNNVFNYIENIIKKDNKC